MMNKLLLSVAIFASAVSASCSSKKTADYTSCALEKLSVDPCDISKAQIECWNKVGCKEECQSFADVSKATLPDCVLPKCTSGCFPFDATVQLETKETKKIGDLQIGDKVHVGKGEFSEVFYFSTKMGAKEVTSAFTSISTTETKSPLLLSYGHFLYVDGELTEARNVVVGSVITLGDGSVAKVTAVKDEWASGLFNPHTTNGDIVVDGVLTSTYTEAVHPTLAHILLAPLRQVYAAGHVSFGDSMIAFSKGLPKWILDLVHTQ